jgi:hypothetical protein
MGMLRTIFVVGGAFAFMPSPPPSETGQSPPSDVNQFTYVAAAVETVADMRSFCSRNPNVCATAGSVARTVEGKVKYSAKLVYEWANDGNETKVLPAPTTNGTLTLADLEPAWRKPKPL